MLSRPLLYTYRRCPYAMRARMALAQAQISFAAHEIALRDKPAGLLAASPKGTVPVLVLPDGEVIDESLDIMRWAFQGRDDGGWWERAGTPANQELIALNDGPFKQHLDRYKYPGRYDPADPALHRDLAVRCLLQPLEQRLAGQPYLGGSQACAADLAIFPFARQYRAVAPDWFDGQPLPATQRWLHAWINGELFNACMKKLPAGLCPAF